MNERQLEKEIEQLSSELNAAWSEVSRLQTTLGEKQAQLGAMKRAGTGADANILFEKIAQQDRAQAAEIQAANMARLQQMEADRKRRMASAQDYQNRIAAQHRERELREIANGAR